MDDLELGGRGYERRIAGGDNPFYIAAKIAKGVGGFAGRRAWEWVKRNADSPAALGLAGVPLVAYLSQKRHDRKVAAQKSRQRQMLRRRGIGGRKGYVGKGRKRYRAKSRRFGRKFRKGVKKASSIQRNLGDIALRMVCGNKKYPKKGMKMYGRKNVILTYEVTAIQNRCNTAMIPLSTTGLMNSLFTAGYAPMLNVWTGAAIVPTEIPNQLALSTSDGIFGDQALQFLIRDQIRIKNNGTESIKVTCRFAEAITYTSVDALAHLDLDVVDMRAGATNLEADPQEDPCLDMTKLPLKKNVGAGGIHRWISQRATAWLKPGQEMQLTINHKLKRLQRVHDASSTWYPGSKGLIVRIEGDVGSVVDAGGLPTGTGILPCGVSILHKSWRKLFMSSPQAKVRLGTNYDMDAGSLVNVNVDGEAVQQA